MRKTILDLTETKVIESADQNYEYATMLESMSSFGRSSKRLSRKRSRDEMEDSEEYLEEIRRCEPLRKRMRIERVAPRRLRRGREVERSKGMRLHRSNSVDRFDNPLSILDRNTHSSELAKKDMKDVSVIAVYSWEAFENFGKKWKQKMDTDSRDWATKSSRMGKDPKELTKLLSKQSRQRIGIDFEKQMTKLLENKTIPHVIAVIEGKQEKSKFTISTTIGEEAKSIPYTRVAYVQGTNAKGASDNKQSMSIYVRDDMREVYSISHETVGWNQL
jgi:hypothetical protein